MRNNYFLALAFLAVLHIDFAWGNTGLVMRESFDTLVIDNHDIFSCDTNVFIALDGFQYMSYVSQGFPTGLSCTLPLSSGQANERIYEMHFGGGGTSMSNSLFVCYGISQGSGLPLPVLADGAFMNTRTGYSVRYIRHGDGSNELIAYRIDSGHSIPLKNDWFPSNPVSTLRKVVIRHSNTGAHSITSVFDTGSTYTRELQLWDDNYPLCAERREVHVYAKGHASTSVILTLKFDTWNIIDRLDEGVKKGN